jgi:hypothetical protein
MLSLNSGCVTFTGIDSGSIEVHEDDLYLKVAFNDRDREYIHDYYRHYRKKHRKKYKKHIPPGLAKKGHMPPGHQRHIEKHGTLPPGLTRYYLPADLEERLTVLPPGYARVRIGGDIVLLDEKTQVAVDVIFGVDEL